MGVSYGEGMLGLSTLFLASADSGELAGGRAQPAVSGASVRGLVVDSAGQPVPGARVGLAASASSAVTDLAGKFELSGLRPGTQALIVRRLGYLPEEVTVNLSRRAPRDVTVRLNVLVPVLEAVVVQARRDLALERVGFASRKRLGSGRFITQEQLARRHALRIEDILSQIPNLRRGVDMNGSCITYWVDGAHWSVHPDEFMSPAEVAAIETYPASLAPIEFQRLDGCAVVLIWTKWKLGIR
ncbi:MAG: carboxypeptidase-like regulatory domain-containing protein [Gemmatimonadaceae bacterium]|nr:carboxypeptidase-like regulatory domain-containing protein [Gemmatimonadaceae bacterium]